MKAYSSPRAYAAVSVSILALLAGADAAFAQEARAGAANTTDEVVVTAQKRRENIQDVPIAITALDQEDLTVSQIAGGPDLMTQVPNFTFTKTNFSSYSIQIRGIGTQAISATTDPGVAVAFNNSPFIRNRFFEQEFYDLERVEVLRGPQGTLYGRNATAGVVNIISAKPSFDYETKYSIDFGNYDSRRLEAMANFPLAEDQIALRLAGAWTQREGYAINEISGQPIDGRDLWSTRATLRFAPRDWFEANLIWEHFEEDDDRLRSGKQLCKTHTATQVGAIPVGATEVIGGNGLVSQEILSQGCERNSLYSPDSFQTPNGYMLPFYGPLGKIFLPTALPAPYLNQTQSPDLRVIESTTDPEYRARTDIAELQIDISINDNLTLTSETSYFADDLFSLQDFNRFNTAPGAWDQEPQSPGGLAYRPGVLNDGVFCDPQLGCSDRLVGVDLSTAQSRQFSQEFRISSDFDGPFNFSLGGNFLRYDTEDKYYVFINALSLYAAISPGGVFDFGTGTLQHPPYVPGETDNLHCLRSGARYGNPNQIYPVTGCNYMDPNPIGSLNDLGHNYFLSRNPFRLISYAAFGEAYYNITDTLKVTGGLRWTVDNKDAPRIPSWTLASESVGYPVAEVIEQRWSEPTGRFTIDWRPNLGFTDETLLYASYAHGYKAGGANPPTPAIVIYASRESGEREIEESATRPRTFEPEFIDAFEIGAKNTLFDGGLTLNTAAFYYDYDGYQVSEIVDRSAFNRNFDAEVWGLEIEAAWQPLENLRFGFKGGYERTRIGNGMQAVDLMDRTAGNADWIVVKPFPTLTSNCIFPAYVFEGVQGGSPAVAAPGNIGGGGDGPCEIAYLFGFDPVTELPYVPNPTTGGSLFQHPNYPGFDPATAPNNGEGFFKDLSGNELPNAPNFTATVTADYSLPLSENWLMTLHSDFYYQSDAWWRVFNDHEYNRLDEYYTVNLAAILTNEESGWNIMAYVKNVFDRTAITGAFLGSDDTGLTTNVFMTEPRLYGLRIAKYWTGMLGRGGDGGQSPDNSNGTYRFTLELGGQLQRMDAPNETLAPSFIDAFSPAIDPTRSQDHDLDWSGGGEATLTYGAGETWNIALGVRYGKTKNTDLSLLNENAQGGCGGPQFYCDLDPKYYVQPVNFATSNLVEREEHAIIDFAVGRDLGIGILRHRSSASLLAGMRYAQFSSSTAMQMEGVPDFRVTPENALINNVQRHVYNASIEADRDFEGIGPILGWRESDRLFGEDARGHLDLDWSVSGGVLFGKQSTSISGSEQASYYDDKYYNRPEPPVSVEESEFSVRRSASATVPTLAASLGLSYSVDRMRLAAGYRWERYFDAIDGGQAEEESFDRTIEGPYFKIAVSFGD